jgi:uncharacterized repeat protein (TIGR01451 family)
VPTVADALDEPSEAFTVTLEGGDTATGTILDANGAPVATVTDAAAAEGAPVTFEVTLSGPSASTVTVQFTTSDGTATAPDDYEAVSTTVTFDPGETVQTVEVPTVDDALDEPSEAFTVTLEGGDTATGTIDDNDVPVASADLRITKTAGATTAVVGSTVSFTISVTNDGPDAATGVTVTDVTPPGTTLVSITPSQGTCTGTVCSLGTLAADATATIALSLIVPSTPGEIVNAASVAATTGDGDLASNSSSASVFVVAAPAETAQVPTLSEWMLLLMVLALGVVAVRRT